MTNFDENKICSLRATVEQMNKFSTKKEERFLLFLCTLSGFKQLLFIFSRVNQKLDKKARLKQKIIWVKKNGNVLFEG